MAFDPSAYQRSRQSINSGYAAESAANLYARQLAQQRGNRNIADLRKQYSQGVPSLGATFAQRGLSGPGVSSGVHQNALQQYAAQNFSAIQGERNQMAESQNQYRLSQAQLTAQRQSSLAELQRQKRAEIAQAAAQLAAFQQYQ